MLPKQIIERNGTFALCLGARGPGVGNVPPILQLLEQGNVFERHDGRDWLASTR